MNQEKMGRFLKTLREEKNLTQERLAEILGVSNRTVSRWETGRNIPDFGMMIQLSDFYGVKLNEIVDGKRESEEKDMEKEEKEALLQLNRQYNIGKMRFIKAINLLLLFGCIGAAGYGFFADTEMGQICLRIMIAVLVTACMITTGYLFTRNMVAEPIGLLNEKVMPATYKCDWSGVGGYLKLANNQLEFEPHQMNLQKKEVKISFHDVEDMIYGKTFGITNLIIVIMKNKNTYKFLLEKEDRERVVMAFQRYREKKD